LLKKLTKRKINTLSIKPLIFICFTLSCLFVKSQNTPSLIPGLSVWLRSDSNLTLAGSSVTSWGDISGNGYLFTEAVSAKQPLIVNTNSKINDYPSINFDGENDGLLSTTNVVLGTAGSSIYMVANLDSHVNYGMFLCYGINGAGSWNFRLRPTAPNITLINAFNNAGAGLSNPSPKNLVVSDFTVLSGSINGTTGQWKVSENNVFSDSTTSSFLQENSNLISIGHRNQVAFNQMEVAEVIIYNRTLSANEHDSIVQYLRTRYAPPVDLGVDINDYYVFCDPVLNASERFTSYTWSTGETTSTITVSQPDTYWVNTLDVFGFSSSDSVEVTSVTDFSMFSPDTTICLGDTLVLNTNLVKSTHTFAWSDLSTDSLLKVTQSGSYYLTVIDSSGCFIKTDTLDVLVDSFTIQTTLGPDTTTCQGVNLGLTSIGANPISYLWNTGEITATTPVDTAGQYWVQVTNINGCVAQDTIQVTLNGIAPVVGFESINFCANELTQFTDTSFTLDMSNIISYKWKFGDGDTSNIQHPNHQYINDATYNVNLEILTDSGCTNNLTLPIQIYGGPTANFTTPAIFCSNLPFPFVDNSTTNGSIVSWAWNFGESGTLDTSSFQNPSYSYVLTDNYAVQLIVKNSLGCKDTVEQVVTVCVDLSPLDIPGLSVWLKSDQNLTLSGSNVSSWGDISGNGYLFSEAVSAKQPLIANTNAKLNDHPSINFDGIDDGLLSTTNVALGTSGSSIYMVANLNSHLDYGMLLCYGTNNVGSWNFRLRSSSPNITLINGANNTGAGLNNPSPKDLSTSNFTILNGSVDSSSSQWNTSENGLLTDSIINPFVQADANIIYIANRGNATHTNLNIAEIILYDRELSSNEHDSIVQYLRIRYAPPVDLGMDINDYYGFCDLLLNASERFTSYTWNTGDTTSSIVVNSLGSYWVTTLDVFGFTSSDTIEVNYLPDLTIFSPDTTICFGDTLVLNTSLNNSIHTFVWSDLSTDSLLKVTQPGSYYLTVTDSLGCFINTDTLDVLVDSFSVQTTLGPDKTICQGANLGLISNTTPTNYIWNTGDTTAQITINTADQYWLQSNNINGCINKDTINLSLDGIAPSVHFTAQALCSNSPSQFTNTSTTSDGSNIISETWFFGDGDSSIVQNPSHQYSSNLIYNISLEVVTDSGCTNALDSTLQIHLPPTAGFFTNNNPICSGSATHFSDNSFSTDGTINSWLWNFGDTGTTDTSTLQSPSYEYPVTNIYTVQLITTTQYGCSDTDTIPVTVKQSPIVSFTTTEPCMGSTTQFNNTSQGNVFALNWNFGDFNTSTLNDPTNTYNSSGTYNVRLIATEVNGCEDTLTTVVTIAENPIANFEARDLCAEASVQLYDSSTTNSGTITNWSWNVVNHANQSNDKDPSFSFTTIDTGSYYIDLILLTDFGCKDSIRDSIQVFPLPDPSFTFTPTTGSPLQLIDFTNETSGTNTCSWNFGDDATSTEINPSHLYQDSSTYVIRLIATSVNGCVDSTSKSIQILYKLTDIAVNDLSYSFISNSEFLSLTTEIANLGSFSITNFDLEIEIEGFGTTLEKWSGSLDAGVSITHAINSYFEVNNEIPEVICVRAINPNNEVDAHPENNEICLTVNKFQLISISPNPSASIIKLSYIIPQTAQTTVTLFDVYGNKVKELFTGSIEKGLIRQNFNLEIFNRGIYVIEIRYQEKAIREKIVLK
jgi:PKD repeat protein